MDINIITKIIKYIMLISIIILICLTISTIIINNPRPVYTKC